MDIVVRTREAIDILEMRGGFEAAVDRASLRQALARTMGAGAPIVILDLTALDRIDADLLGELLEARRRARAAGGVLKLVAPKVHGALLSDAGFSSPSDVYVGRDQAVESFEPETMTAGIP